MDQNQQDNKELWDSFLNFLCLEVFGVEVFDYYRAGRGTLEEVGEKDKVAGVPLADRDVKLWRIADAASAYILDKKFFLTTGRLNYLLEANSAIRKLFWALVRNNEAAHKSDVLEVRKGGPQGVLLVCGTPSANPLIEILSKIGR